MYYVRSFTHLNLVQSLLMQRARELLFNWICVWVWVANKKENLKSNNISVHMEISWKCARSHGSILMLDVYGCGCSTFRMKKFIQGIRCHIHSYLHKHGEKRSHYANLAYRTYTDTFYWHCEILLLCYCYSYSIRLHSKWICHITAMQSVRFPPLKIFLSKRKFRQADKHRQTHTYAWTWCIADWGSERRVYPFSCTCRECVTFFPPSLLHFHLGT